MKRTQTERVYDALKRAGDRGICRTDFLAPTCDGKAPIVNFPGRIFDVQRKLGVELEVIGERHGCHVFRIVESGPIVLDFLGPEGCPYPACCGEKRRAA